MPAQPNCARLYSTYTSPFCGVYDLPPLFFITRPSFWSIYLHHMFRYGANQSSSYTLLFRLFRPGKTRGLAGRKLISDQLIRHMLRAKRPIDLQHVYLDCIDILPVLTREDLSPVFVKVSPLTFAQNIPGCLVNHGSVHLYRYICLSSPCLSSPSRPLTTTSELIIKECEREREKTESKGGKERDEPLGA
jgi:hypothetical protein